MSDHAVTKQTAEPVSRAARDDPNRSAALAASNTRYKWYALAVLILIALFNYIDRQSLAILQIQIKHELGLSDTQLGALTGIAFALLYSTLALPIARLADRYKRSVLISIALAIWSLMTAACGLATGMMTLALFRMGVALGEAGCVPATHSLISDFFKREQRATAIGIWTLSFPIGTMLGFMAGGWLSSSFGWRQAFYILGIAGLCLVPLVLLTLREPQRGALETTVQTHEVPALRDAIRRLWSLRTFRHATLAGALVDFTMYASLNWNAPFYNRVFNLSISELALPLALLSGVGGGAGVYLGGLLADRLGRRDPRWYMWVPALTSLIPVPLMMIQYFTTSYLLSICTGVLTATLLSAFLAPLVATSQSLVTPNMRAFTSAVLVLCVNLVGLGLGPLVTGMISDFLVVRFDLGHESLRYAIAASALVALWSAVHFMCAARYVRDELPR